MKNFLSLLYLFIFFNAESQKTDFSNFILNSNSVIKEKKVKAEIYYGHFSEHDSAVYCRNIYDTTGRLISSVHYMKNGKILFSDSLITKNNRSAFKFFYGSTGKIMLKQEFKYSAKGDYTGWREFNKKGKLVYENNCDLNDKGECYLITQLTDDKTRFAKEIMLYDFAGNLSNIIQVMQNGDTTKTLYKYKSNRLAQFIFTDPFITRTETSCYNDKNLLEKIDIREINKLSGVTKISREIFSYDTDSPLCTERNCFEDDVIVEKTTCKYQYYPPPG